MNQKKGILDAGGLEKQRPTRRGGFEETNCQVR